MKQQLKISNIFLQKKKIQNKLIQFKKHRKMMKQRRIET